MRLPIAAKLLAALSFMALFSAPLAAHDVTLPAEERTRPYSGDLPACDHPEVLSTIRSRFQQRESGYWNSSLTIDAIDRVGVTATRPWGRDFIPRRFCHARAALSNGDRHSLIYSIMEDGGIISFSWGVQWCVVGLDRNMHFAPECRAARP
jgi:hypothetical protein